VSAAKRFTPSAACSLGFFVAGALWLQKAKHRHGTTVSILLGSLDLKSADWKSVEIITYRQKWPLAKRSRNQDSRSSTLSDQCPQVNPAAFLGHKKHRSFVNSFFTVLLETENPSKSLQVKYSRFVCNRQQFDDFF
jgi:hypothetical protein